VYVSKAVYTDPGLNLEGRKDILGLYLSETEGANFWLSILTDLNNSGLEDILIACVDGLTGSSAAITLRDRFCEPILHRVLHFRQGRR